MFLATKNTKITKESEALFSRNFLLFVFFVAKSSTYKCYHSAFGVPSTSLPVQKRIPIVRLATERGGWKYRAIMVRKNGWNLCAIMVRNEVRWGSRAITVWNGYGVRG